MLYSIRYNARYSFLYYLYFVLINISEVLDDSASISPSQFVLEQLFANQTVNSYDISPAGIGYYSLYFIFIICLFNCFLVILVIIIWIGTWMGIARFSDSAWMEANITCSKQSLMNTINNLNHQLNGYQLKYFFFTFI